MSWKHAALHDEELFTGLSAVATGGSASSSGSKAAVGASASSSQSKAAGHAASSTQSKPKHGDWKKAALKEEEGDAPALNMMVDWKRGPLQEDGNPRPLKKRTTGKAWKKQPLMNDGPGTISSDDENLVQDQNEMVMVHLSLPLLRMLPADDKPSTTYALNGMSADRIKDMSSSHCRGQKTAFNSFLYDKQKPSTVAGINFPVRHRCKS